jgi:hypothetical protein
MLLANETARSDFGVIDPFGLKDVQNLCERAVFVEHGKGGQLHGFLLFLLGRNQVAFIEGFCLCGYYIISYDNRQFVI